jgi:hypothetical protein
MSEPQEWAGGIFGGISYFLNWRIVYISINYSANVVPSAHSTCTKRSLTPFFRSISGTFLPHWFGLKRDMRSITNRPMIFSLILAIGITLTLPYVALSAGYALVRSGGFKAGRTHRQRGFSHPVRSFGFFGVDEPVDQQIIIIQQYHTAPVSEAKEPAKKGTYVQPRWVDAGYGVQVLEPGHWVDAGKSPGP